MRPRARIRAALRAGAALALGLSLGACASGGPTLFERLGTFARTTLAAPEAEEAPGPAITRAQLGQVQSALIAVSKEDGPRAFLVPLADNGGYVNYRDAGGDAVILRGGAVSGTESLGYDLQGVRHDRRDPIAHRTPLAAWPGRVQRDYQYAVRDLDRYRITLDCVFEPVVRETIEIIELRFDVVRVQETCTNAARQITNTYWVDSASGFIWKSEQWLGPVIGQVTVEIIRPYAG